MMEVFNMISGWLDFRVFFGVGYWSVCCELLGMYLEVMQIGDFGMIVVVVEVLCNENFKFDVLMFNIIILEEVFKKLEFLKEIEIYNQLQ